MDAALSPRAGHRMVRVWDPLVRIGHWTLVAGFVAAFLTEEGDLFHQAAGYLVAAVVTLRLLWGLVGSYHARFATFVPSPRRLLDHLRDLARGREHRYLGHNPAAGAMVVALLGLMVLLSVTGWMLTTDAYYGSGWLEAVHEGGANLALLLVFLHVGGAIYESIRHGENLPWAMVTGRKRP